MDGRDIFALIISLVVLVGFVVIASMIAGTPQELTGYDITLADLYEDESFVVAPLSPSLESAELGISADSDYIFLLTGDPEIVAVQADDSFVYEGSAVSGEWKVIEGSDLNLNIHSETALKVTADRGLSYHLLSIMLVFFALFLFWIWLMYLIYS